MAEGGYLNQYAVFGRQEQLVKMKSQISCQFYYEGLYPGHRPREQRERYLEVF